MSAAFDADVTQRFLVCVGPRCDAEGGGRALHATLADALARRFPEALASGRLSLQTRDCLRVCTREQIVRLEPSGEVFSNPCVEELLRAVASECGDDPAC